MKKFLCYDTNDAASGKISVSTNGVLSPNATVPSTNGAANQYLVTDSDGNAKWEDRLAYDKGRKNLLVINFAWIDNGYRIETEDMAMQFHDICDNYSEVMVAIGGQDLLMTTNWASGEYSLIYNNKQIIRNYIGGAHPYLIHLDLDNTSSIGIVGNSLGNEATVTLYIDGGVKQIDPKYIPDTTVKVNITANEDDTISADKTYDEVKSLIDSGADVKCVFNDMIVFDYISNEGGEAYCFEFKSVAFDLVYAIIFTQGGLVIKAGSFGDFVFPKVSTSDNNKFLSVVNGTWQASSDLIVPSSTSGSTKKFKITVDDSGVITATEV